MNIENVEALAKQLAAIGIENATSSLLKRICFHPEKFTLERRIAKGSDTVSLQFLFQKAESAFEYALCYYDASLLNEPQMPEEAVNGVSIPALDQEMSEIDWKKAFALDESKPIVLDDKRTWEEEARIEAVVSHLASLEASGEGKRLASMLKQKYWFGFAPPILLGAITPVKDKADISQRFYPQGGQSLISVDEAYRFLQNKRLEKQMQGQKKQLNGSGADSGMPGETAAPNTAWPRKRGAGKGKRGSKTFRSKSNP